MADNTTKTKRDIQVHTYLNASEKERLDKLTERWGLSQASLVRRAVLRELALQEAGL